MFYIIYYIIVLIIVVIVVIHCELVTSDLKIVAVYKVGCERRARGEATPHPPIPPPTVFFTPGGDKRTNSP